MTTCGALARRLGNENTAQPVSKVLRKWSAALRGYHRSHWHGRALAAAEAATSAERADALRLFAANLYRTFYWFEQNFFQHNLLRIVDDVVGVINASIERWPTLVEICYFQKGRKGLPQVRVNNQRK